MALCGTAHAATAATNAATPAAAGATAAPAAAAGAIPPSKQALIDKLLDLWHMENVGLNMLQVPVSDAVTQAKAVLQGRATDAKRDAAMSEVVTEARKFMEDTVPTVKTSAQKLMPTKVAPLLAERFSEDELKQMIAILESPVKAKFEALLPELQKSLGEAVAADSGPVINPKLQDLKQRIGMRLRAAVTP
ncbi:DUF2059 domain-containing protein [Duganella ginsengisoli]|uniref:DUF2059 domain-containing protein n=2 Tax=Pseudoduganella ginsengisoli TaxID=1462440 RepID=A0A6L6Q6G7_9BURK|nr:DUF2059 domain-containing protein [Pseudoduganella ginsengisoli]